MHWHRLDVSIGDEDAGEIVGYRSDGVAFFAGFTPSSGPALTVAVRLMEEFRTCTCTVVTPCEKHVETPEARIVRLQVAPPIKVIVPGVIA